jgi:hypothetical protein
MDLNDEELNKVIDFIRKEYAWEEPLSRSTSLLHDLKLYGDDVNEFFARLIRHFDVKVVEVDVSRFYIGDEDFDFISPLVRFFKGEKSSEKPTILLKDIKNFIITGKLT